MLLDDIVKNPIECLIHMERYVNKGSPSGFAFKHSTSDSTKPKSKNKYFDLPLLEVPKKDCLIEGDPRKKPKQFILNGPNILYPVHPDIVDDINIVIEKSYQVKKHIKVQPTSSARTVIYNGEKEKFYVKLHYPKLIGRFNRGLPYSKWIAAFENHSEIIRGIKEGKAPTEFCLLRQDFGYFLLYSIENYSGAGMIFREIMPYPKKKDEIQIPFFSLFSVDEAAPTHPLLINQLFERLNEKPMSIIEKIIIPLIKCFKFHSMDLGFLPEYNAQNILLAWNPKNTTFRIIHRDMMGTFKDIHQRKKLGLSANLSIYHTTDFDKNKEDCFMRRSFAYDFNLGEYVIYEIEKWLTELGYISVKNFRREIRELFREIVTENPTEYFGSDNWFGYRKVLPKGKRPYIIKKSPKYR